jgi:hypothetical protein
MRRVGATLAVVLLVTTFSAPALAAIEIKRISFDPAGADTGANLHLNREYIYLVNTGPRAKQLRGWKVIDKGRDHVYRFGALLLEPGDTIRLRSGRGDDGAPACEVGEPCPEHAHYDFHWGLDNYVWNNDGDRATVKDSEGNVVDRCSYGSTADSPKAC